jgi:hypothetical protein
MDNELLLYNSVDCQLLVNDHDIILSFRKKNAEQRQNVITELVLTEKEYVRDLKITYEIFNLYNPRPLEERGIDAKVVFGNILEASKKCLMFGLTSSPLPFSVVHAHGPAGQVLHLLSFTVITP